MEKSKIETVENLMGKEASFEERVSEELIEDFAELSQDRNPIHSSKTNKNPIAHGMIAGMFFSRLVGMHLPGPGSIYLSQNLLFKKPVSPETTVVVSGIVVQTTQATNVVRIKMKMSDKSDGSTYVEGEALVKAP